MYKKNKGFTLIELMVAMAIIALLAAVLLVGMQGYGKDARASKALAQASSTIPSIVSCYGNGNSVSWPSNHSTGGGPICSSSPSYGSWPKVSSGTDLSGYEYNSWADLSQNTSSNNWALDLGSNYYNGDGKVICCNSAMKGCKILSYSYSNSVWDNGAVCSPDSPSN